MLSGKYVSTCLLLLLCSAVFILNMSCSDTGEPTHNNTPVSETPGVIYKTDNNPPITETPGVMYKTYETRLDDVRFELLEHPRYRFEYPSIFNLVDINISWTPSVVGESRVEFSVQELGLPKPWLSVVIEEPGIFEYLDAHGKLEQWYSFEHRFTDNTSIGTASVNGLLAEYLKSFADIGESRPYPAHQASARTVVFDYAGLIWEIRLTWDYHGSEPPEVEGYFNHIIETFEILE